MLSQQRNQLRSLEFGVRRIFNTEDTEKTQRTQGYRTKQLCGLFVCSVTSLKISVLKKSSLISVFCILFFYFTFLSIYADFELIDEESIIDTEEHLYFMLDRVNIQTASRIELAEIIYLTDQDITNILNYRRRNIIINISYLIDAGLSRETIENILPFIEFGRSRRLEFSFINYLRFQDTTDNFRNINRIEAKNNVYDLRLHQEYNTVSENTPIPFGASLTIRRNPTSRLVLGQYQLNHGYGLLLSRGSFISQRPGFNTDLRQNRTILSANARPFYSRSFLGAAYEKSFSENFTFHIFSSLKDTGARVTDEQIERLLIDERNPRDTVLLSNTGSILHYQNNALNISTALNYTISEIEFQDDDVTAFTGSVAASYQYSNYLFFSETAYSNSTFANITGIRNSYQRFTQLLIFRHFENDYNAIWGDYISNSSNMTNEQGLFYKIEFRNREYAIQTFADLFNNIENHERYLDRNQGVSWGINAEKFGLFDYNDMSIGISYRQKTDKEWRNLSGITQYEDRKRDYFKATWQQTNTRFLRTRLVYNYQSREYPDYNIKNTGYALSQIINMQYSRYRVSFTGGVFDTEYPIYLYLYSGRLNNSMFVLTGEGQYAMLHLNISLRDKLNLELMNSILRKDIVEYSASVVAGYSF